MTENASQRARAAMQRGDWPAALAAFGEVLAAAPDDVNAVMGCGIIHGQTGNLAEAARFLQRAAVLQPDWPDVHINLSKLAIEQGDWQKAEQSARRAIALSPALAIAHENLVVALKRLRARSPLSPRSMLPACPRR